MGKSNISELRLADIMTSEVLTSGPDETVFDVVMKMRANNIGAIIVVDQSMKCLGIFTERDIINKVIPEKLDLETTHVSSVMTPDPETLDQNTFINDAYCMMEKGNFRHVPVVEGGKLKGIVSMRDIDKLFWHELTSKISEYLALIQGFTEICDNVEQIKRKVLGIE
ncbi:MAG: CBS domain-containing protein [Candidatus Omnitrophica bacterium]|nr:CBS domain-containing protein [Candidatus Omnitrophota bacterium]